MKVKKSARSTATLTSNQASTPRTYTQPDNLTITLGNQTPMESLTASDQEMISTTFEPFSVNPETRGRYQSILFSTSPSPYSSFSVNEQRVFQPYRQQYCINSLREAITTLVLTGQNVFIHPTLYQHLPTAFQDLLAVCSLYMHRTPMNSTSVFQFLLLKRQSLVERSKDFHTPEDWLLATQAMICYFFLLRFDEEFNDLCKLDHGFQTLGKWTRILQQKYFEVDARSSLSSSTSTSAEKKDKQWILLESIRRTIMVSVLCQCVYTHLKDGYSELVPVLEALPVSQDIEAWNGGSTLPLDGSWMGALEQGQGRGQDGSSDLRTLVPDRGGGGGLITYYELAKKYNYSGRRWEAMLGDEYMVRLPQFLVLCFVTARLRWSGDETSIFNS